MRMAKRQSGKLHNLHIRIKESDYEKISDMCDKLGITIAEYFNSLLESDGYDKLQMYAKTIKNTPRSIEVSFESDDTRQSMDEMTSAMSQLSRQTQAMGRNVSNLIRDIRNGNVAAQSALPVLEKMNKHLESQTHDCAEINATLSTLLYTDREITKTEVRYKNGGY